MPTAWISPTSTLTVDARVIPANAPPAAEFDVHDTANVTVAPISKRPPGDDTDDDRYVCVQVDCAVVPRCHATPGPVHNTVVPSPILHDTDTGRAVTVELTRPAFAVAS